MGLFNNKLKKEVQELKEVVNEQKREIMFLVDDILTIKSSSKSYIGNNYQSYDEAVKEIDKKYRGKADWGVLLTGNIIDVRSAFILGQGVNILNTKKKGDGKREEQWVKEFMRVNGLTAGGLQELAKEAEIEGRFLGWLIWDDEIEWENEKGEKEKGMVKLRYVSWLSKGYKVITDNKDYMKYLEVRWNINGENVVLKENEFVYRGFGGRISKPNEPAPKIWKCLTQIENLDKALRDFREINNLFASPTPHIEVESEDAARRLNERIKKINWRVKKLLVHTGKFKYETPDMSGLVGLEKEVIMLAKFISGTTGVPVHFLGLPDLMSNRATADNLMELVWASTVKEREIWEGALNEVVEKAMMLYNEKKKRTPLVKSNVYIDIQNITEAQWKHLKDVILPLFVAGGVSKEFLWEQIPGLDVQIEKQREEEMDMKIIEEFKRNTVNKEKFKGD